MNTDYFIKVTLAVYRVTELFSEGEFLQSQIRELANRILADLILFSRKDLQTPDVCKLGEKIGGDIETIKNCFNSAETQNWIDPRNFLVLTREYDKIQKLLKDRSDFIYNGLNLSSTIDLARSGLVEADKNEENSFSPAQERQEKVLRIIKEKKKVQVGELVPNFPQVSRRTLIRDLEELFQAGIIKRGGNGRGVCYVLKN